MSSYEEIRPRELKPALLELDGISRASVEAHYKLYQGYVNKRNEILGKLGSADRIGEGDHAPRDARPVEDTGDALAWLDEYELGRSSPDVENDRRTVPGIQEDMASQHREPRLFLR